METTLYNKNGQAVAYIAEDGETVYTWEGRAVAYLADDKVFGWNGKHLGWFNEGTIFDIYGLRAGFIRSKAPLPTQMEPLKPVKQMQPVKNPRQVPVVKPILLYGYSEKKLEEMLAEGGLL